MVSQSHAAAFGQELVILRNRSAARNKSKKSARTAKSGDARAGKRCGCEAMGVAQWGWRKKIVAGNLPKGSVSWTARRREERVGAI